MPILTLPVVVVTGIIVGLVVVLMFPAVKAYFTYRGERLITCPENNKAAAVHVSAKSAAEAGFLGVNSLRLDHCSRWPEHNDCGQECLNQIEIDPARCQLWNIVSKWYADKTCVFCDKPIGTLRHLDHTPALLGPEGFTTEWSRFRPEQLPSVFATHRAVCWDCHVTRTFRQLHPELVIDRHRDQYPTHS